MPRIARVVAEGLPHHVTQRGNNRQRVFDSDHDRLLYLKLLREYSERHRLGIWGYCLMDNHVHLIVVPQHVDALARTLRQTHADYSRYANVKRRSSGHFWQNRYYSCPLDGLHCWQALAYVERNPVRAGMVDEACKWSWSSAQMHLGEVDAGKWLDLTDWRKEYDPQRWREVLRTSVAGEAEAERIRESTLAGKPLGDKAFVTSDRTTARPPAGASQTWPSRADGGFKPRYGLGGGWRGNRELRSPSRVLLRGLRGLRPPRADGPAQSARGRWRLYPQHPNVLS